MIMESVEKECGALGGLFQAIVNDMKVPELDEVDSFFRPIAWIILLNLLPLFLLIFRTLSLAMRKDKL